MKIKTKYNIGDIIQFPTNNSEIKIGKISKVVFSYSKILGSTISYNVDLIEIPHSHFVNSINVEEYQIYQKLNKRAFEKAYAEECAKSILKGNTKVVENEQD